MAQVESETILDDNSDSPTEHPPEDIDPDLPPESTVIKITDEVEWLGAVVYDRGSSTKGSTNPKASIGTTTNNNSSSSSNTTPKPKSNSQRFTSSLKPIIGLPNKIQSTATGYLGRSSRRSGTTNARIFPKNSGNGHRKPSEPGSPKVSCVGRVLSDRDKELCSHKCQNSTKKSGCWASIGTVFSCCGGRGEERAAEEKSCTVASTAAKTPMKEKRIVTEMEAPELGAMKRFASGRRGELLNERPAEVEGGQLQGSAAV